MKLKIGIVGFLAFVLSSCTNEGLNHQAEKTEKSEIETKNISDGDLLFHAVLQKHGGENYDSAHFGFVFRKTDYTFKNSASGYLYTREFNKDVNRVLDEMTANGFTRQIDGIEIELSEEEITKYRSSINSVIYFATLPHKLGDASVNREYVGMESVKGQSYKKMKVSFNQKGGGEDFDDEYLFWINSTSNCMDYFAYNYKVNGGGVRFRSANNVRFVDGILFQDYVNYKAPIGTALEDLPAMFEKGELVELSQINTEDVKSLSTN